MGTDEELARRAVRESGGDGEKAQLWLFSHQEKAERQKQGPAAAAGAAGGKAQAAGGAPQPTAAQLAEEAYRRERAQRVSLYRAWVSVLRSPDTEQLRGCAEVGVVSARRGAATQQGDGRRQRNLPPAG